jgi:hypothetical protein
LLITGAKYKGMVDRVADIVDRYLTVTDPNRAYKFGRITCQVGMRPRQIALEDGTMMDGTVEDIIAGLSQGVRDNPWVQHELSKFQDPDRPAGTGQHDKDLWWGPFSTEAKLIMLGIIKAYDGNARVVNFERIHEGAIFPEVPARTWASAEMILPDGTPVLVLNAPAVKRSHGDARPTTKSSTDYWLDHYSPEFGASIVGVSGPTHGYRVMHVFERTLHVRRPDVTVLGISRPAVDGWAVFNNALAEAIWLTVKAFEELNSLLPAEVATIQEWRFDQIQEQTLREIEKLKNETAGVLQTT